jgi:hypothetical protein
MNLLEVSRWRITAMTAWLNPGWSSVLCAQGALPSQLDLATHRISDFSSPRTSMPDFEVSSCMKACIACAIACRETAHRLRNIAYHASFIQQCLDCGIQCSLCCSDLRGNSPHLVYSSRMCAIACEVLAVECSKYKFSHFNHCKTACRHCATECRAIRVAVGEQAIAGRRNRGLGDIA